MTNGLALLAHRSVCQFSSVQLHRLNRPIST